MPLPVLLGPAAFGGPAAAAAAKTAVTVGAEMLPTISSASLAAVLVRLAWKRVPDWIREDVSFTCPEGKSLEEMETLSSVIEKLQAMLTTGSEKLSDPVPNLYAAILAYIQLSAQLKERNPTNRDELYHSSGRQLESGPIRNFEAIKEALDYATLAYYVEDDPATFLREELEKTGYSLVQQSVARRPGSVSHYVAVSREQQRVIIGMKGTSSLEDLMTDVCGQAVPYNLADEEDLSMERVEVRGKIDDELVTLLDESVEILSGHEKISILQGYDEDLDIHCHEGILISAKRLADHVQSIVEERVVGDGYSLMMVGHSLGAGAATLLAAVLRSRIPKLSEDNIQVYAFAPPPVMDHDVALGSASFVTSIANNSDIIPRWSLANLSVFLEFLRVISDKLQENGLQPTGPRSTAAFLKKLSTGNSGDMLMTSDEVWDAMEAAHDKVELRHPDHLYVAGHVLLMFKNWSETKNDDIEKENPQNVGDLKHYCVVGDGTMPVLRFFEIDGYRMLSDHLTASCYASIDSIISKDSCLEPRFGDSLDDVP
jgi:hypothetical protein